MKKYCSSDAIGGIMALLGLSGMAESVTGHGSFLVSMIVFVVGFCLVLWGYRK